MNTKVKEWKLNKKEEPLFPFIYYIRFWNMILNNIRIVDITSTLDWKGALIFRMANIYQLAFESMSKPTDWQIPSKWTLTKLFSTLPHQIAHMTHFANNYFGTSVLWCNIKITSMHSFLRLKTIPLLNSKVVADLIGTLTITIQVLFFGCCFSKVENAILSLWETVERISREYVWKLTKLSAQFSN